MLSIHCLADLKILLTIRGMGTSHTPNLSILTSGGSLSDSYNISYPHYLGATFDASTTNLSYVITAPGSGQSVRIKVSFLSPVTPTSTYRQSIPAAYIAVYVAGDFNVNIYIDVNKEWATGQQDNEITWSFKDCHDYNDKGIDKPALKTWMFGRQNEQLLTEIDDRAEWGALLFSGPLDCDHEFGSAAETRGYFAQGGRLRNTSHGMQSMDDNGPVFAFSKSFQLNGTSSQSGKPSAIFTISHVQDIVAQYASARGLTMMRPLWQSWHESVDDMTLFHYFDFETASQLAGNYSDQLAIDALQSGSENYKDIVALSARQVMGATSFSGTPDNPLLFLKEISSNGDFQTVDVIFPAFPFFLYTNPRWLAYLLEPLLEHQMSGQYPNENSMHDLGVFPNATGHPDGRDEYMPVEECGNMLIMGLALIQSLNYDTTPASIWATAGEHSFDLYGESPFPLLAGSDANFDNTWGGPVQDKGSQQAKKWVQKYFKLWKQWTGYLVTEALIPANQLSTDDFAGWLANQTNLALKGIIGIRAMSEIFGTLEMYNEAAEYRAISDDYVRKWEEYGISRDGTHAKVAYTWYGSWATIYNLFADALLCFHLPPPSSSASPTEYQPSESRGRQQPLKLYSEKRASRTAFVDERVYKMQSSWYHNVMQKYGLPLDSRHLYTKSDWEFFAAAVTSTSVRAEILESVARWVNETVTGVFFSFCSNAQNPERPRAFAENWWGTLGGSSANLRIDKPFTDLYESEGHGEFAGSSFFARPVVGGHFAFLALERSCGGKAMEGLRFLDEETESERIDDEL
jgi:hypothetical protein